MIAWHNSFVQVAVDLGFPGLVVVLLGLGGMVCKTLGLMKLDVRMLGAGGVLMAALGGIFFGGMVNACFESWLWSVGNMVMLVFWLAMVAFLKGLYLVHRTQVGYVPAEWGDPPAAHALRGRPGPEVA